MTWKRSVTAKCYQIVFWKSLVQGLTQWDEVSHQICRGSASAGQNEPHDTDWKDLNRISKNINKIRNKKLLSAFRILKLLKLYLNFQKSRGDVL